MPESQAARRGRQRAPSSEVEALEDQIMREAQLQRKHELVLAKVNASREHDLAQVARDRAKHRNVVIGWVFGGAFIAIVIMAIILAVSHATSEDRRNREREHDRQQQLTELCVREGNIWVDGDCLITRRDP